MNLVLKCSEEDLNNLIKQSIIEPGGNNTFILYTKANLKGQCYPVLIDYDEADIDIPTIKRLENNNSVKTLENWYKEFRLTFPTNASEHLGIEDGTNLRVGNKTKIKKSLQKLIDEGFAMQDVLEAAQYEVWFRIKQSTASENKLEFMKRMQTWVNDESNLEVMIERSKKSVDFQNSLTQDNETNSSRKINLA